MALVGSWQDAKFNLPAPWRQVFGKPSDVGLGGGMSPAAFFAFRCALVFFWGAISIWSILDQTDRKKEPGGEWFIYLTNWSLLFELLYLLLAALLTGIAGGTADAVAPPKDQDLKTPWFARVAFALQGLTYVFSFVAFALYWALDASGKTVHAITPFTHGVNFVIALADCLVAGIPMRLVQVWLPLFVSLLYCIFTMIYDLAGGKAGLDPYIYEVIDWSDEPGKAILYSCVIILVLFPGVFTVCVYGVMPARAKCNYRAAVSSAV